MATRAGQRSAAAPRRLHHHWGCVRRLCVWRQHRTGSHRRREWASLQGACTVPLRLGQPPSPCAAGRRCPLFSQTRTRTTVHKQPIRAGPGLPRWPVDTARSTSLAPRKTWTRSTALYSWPPAVAHRVFLCRPNLPPTSPPKTCFYCRALCCSPSNYTYSSAIQDHTWLCRTPILTSGRPGPNAHLRPPQLVDLLRNTVMMYQCNYTSCISVTQYEKA